MKAKSFNKKLSLKKETITNLGTNQMDDARGGITGGANTCPSCLLVACPLSDTPDCYSKPDPLFTCNPDCISKTGFWTCTC